MNFHRCLYVFVYRILDIVLGISMFIPMIEDNFPLCVG